MNNQQILEKAIQKAIDGGWKLGKEPTPENIKSASDYLAQGNFPLVIFEESFAKALWPGNMPVITRLPNWAEPTPAWISHLQAMVIAQDPIKYLGDNI